MQYVVIGYDGTDEGALSRRMAVREAHLALGDKMQKAGKLQYAVALLDDNEKMIGSVMIGEFESRAEVDAWLKIEPYVVGKVWEKIEIRKCRGGPSFQKNN